MGVLVMPTQVFMQGPCPPSSLSSPCSLLGRVLISLVALCTEANCGDARLPWMRDHVSLMRAAIMVHLLREGLALPLLWDACLRSPSTGCNSGFLWLDRVRVSLNYKHTGHFVPGASLTLARAQMESLPACQGCSSFWLVSYRGSVS